MRPSVFVALLAVVLIVPAAAGSNTDVLARVFAAAFERVTKPRSIYVDDRPGANGDIGKGGGQG